MNTDEMEDEGFGTVTAYFPTTQRSCEGDILLKGDRIQVVCADGTAYNFPAAISVIKWGE